MALVAADNIQHKVVVKRDDQGKAIEFKDFFIPKGQPVKGVPELDLDDLKARGIVVDDADTQKVEAPPPVQKNKPSAKKKAG